MEDALKFLLVAGIIIYGLVKQTRKKAARTLPADDAEADGIPAPSRANPLPENWGQAPHASPAARPPHRQPAPEPFIPPAHRKPAPRRSTPTPASATPPPTASPAPPAAPAPEVDVHALDEVRKGIIWAEILHRKY